MKIDNAGFVNRGLVTLRGFLDQKKVAAARESIFAELERLKIKVNGKIVSSKVQNLPIFQQTVRLGQLIRVGDQIGRLFSEDLLSVADSLAGSTLRAATAEPQVLLSLPHKADWSLANLNWHLDLAPLKIDQILGIQAFILINDVHPHGGATLALAGSHKLHYIYFNHNAHAILREHSDFYVKPEKFSQAQVVCGTHVQIVEMCGRAGDVFLMDLRVLHSPSINSNREIRMMATNRFLKS